MTIRLLGAKDTAKLRRRWNLRCHGRSVT